MANGSQIQNFTVLSLGHRRLFYPIMAEFYVLCSKHESHAQTGSNRFMYSKDPAFPTRLDKLTGHITSERHNWSTERPVFYRLE